MSIEEQEFRPHGSSSDRVRIVTVRFGVVTDDNGGEGYDGYPESGDAFLAARRGLEGMMFVPDALAPSGVRIVPDPEAVPGRGTGMAFQDGARVGILGEGGEGLRAPENGDDGRSRLSGYDPSADRTLPDSGPIIGSIADAESVRKPSSTGADRKDPDPVKAVPGPVTSPAADSPSARELIYERRVAMARGLMRRRLCR